MTCEFSHYENSVFALANEHLPMLRLVEPRFRVFFFEKKKQRPILKFTSILDIMQNFCQSYGKFVVWKM